MLVASVEGCRQQASTATRSQGSFQCPNCMEPVILRQGTVRVAHFAHKAVTTCAWAVGESAIHLHAKQVLVNALRASGYDANPEVTVGLQRADVYVEQEGVRFALELQHTPIDPRELERRTRGYIANGLYVAWLSLVDINYRCFHEQTPVPVPMRYSPRPFERWMEVYGSGKLLLFNPAMGDVLQGRFRAHKTRVPVSAWTGRGGEQRTGGGYDRTSRQHADLFCDQLLPLNKLALEQGWRGSELRVSGMSFPRGGCAKLVSRADEHQF